ncbi:hypothetical protein CBD41_07360 [bacterium TMED181]|nr:sulfatase-modifying factor [Planctomycetota bacterium]OUW43341.1 MAG: hypothetical protein CBD41_07360 [bacterium TMED181]
MLTIILLALQINITHPAPPVDDSAKAEIISSYQEKLPGTDLTIDWIAIPVGEVGYPSEMELGSPTEETDRKEDEGPVWKFRPEPFWMMKFEVTWDLYYEFLKEYRISQDRRLDPSTASSAIWADAVSIPTPLWEQDARPIMEGLGTSGGFPAADITQFAAMQFSKWLSKKTGQFLRLPTEAEWEYAARCGKNTAYSFGDDSAELTKYAWIFDNSEYEDEDAGFPGLGAGYRKVGTLKPNRWGIHDLYGNVAEWTLDRYSEDAYQSRAQKPLTSAEAVVWPEKIWPAVVRGGSWQDDSDRCRSAARTPSTSKWQKRDPQIPKSVWWCTDAFHVGFRLIRPASPPDQPIRWWDPEISSIQRKLKSGYKELRVPLGNPAPVEKE